jgi:hypothetical protein
LKIRGRLAYSKVGPRSVVKMDARRALLITNDMVSIRPFVVLAIKVMGPGRRRVEMVKLAHDMHDARSDVWQFQARLQLAVNPQPQAVPPSQRAA